MTDPILFLLAAAALLAAPGPTNTLLATAGAERGLRDSLGLVGAALAAYLIAVAVYRFALGQVLVAFPLLGAGLKVAVALYVAWLAVRLWRSSTVVDRRPVRGREVFVATLLNPKAFIAALTILPGGAGTLLYLPAFAAIVVVAATGWVLLGSAIAASAGARHEHLIPRVASVALVGFAGVIAASVLG
jgi:threonine/homoserine/homoserine lactone efflux protein